MLAACQLVPVPTRNRRLPRSRSAAASTPVVSASMPRSCSGWDCIVSLIKLTATLPSMVHGSIARYWVRGCQPASRVRRDRAARRRLLGAEREHDRVRAAPIVCSGFVTPPHPPAAGVRLVTVATGLDSPVDVAAIPGTAKLAVVEKTGRVLVVTDGHPAQRPLLDLRGQVSQGSEQGLLSIVFSPRYANERSRLRRLHRPGREYPRRRAGHPQRQPADAPVRAPAVREPQRRGAGVRPRRAAVRGHGRRRQRGRPARATARTARRCWARSCGWTSRKPNPRPQMYAYGLRNPWRFSFDPATGDLWIGDVGQNRYEEVDRLAGRDAARRQPGVERLRGPSGLQAPADRPLAAGVAGRRLPAHRGLLDHRRLRLPRQRGAGAARPLRLRRLLLRPDLVAPRSAAAARSCCRCPGWRGCPRSAWTHTVSCTRPRSAAASCASPRPRLGYRRAPADHPQRATPAGIAGAAVGRRPRPAARRTSWPASSCTGPGGPAWTPPGCGSTSSAAGAATSAAPRWPTRS